MSSVYLAVGHGVTPDGRQDPGAAGNGWTEQSAGDVIVATAAKTLLAAGIEVHSEAHTDDPNFIGSRRAANALGVDAVVAVHHDIATAPRGSFAYHYPGSPRGQRLATICVQALEEAGAATRPAWRGPGLGFADGPVTERNLHILRETAMPATLVEIGPVGTFTREELVRLGEALAAAVAAYFGISLVQAAEKTEPFPAVKWAQVVVYDPRTDGRDRGAATVLAKKHRLRLLPITSHDTAHEAYLVGRAGDTAYDSRYTKRIKIQGRNFGETAKLVGEWCDKLVRL